MALSRVILECRSQYGGEPAYYLDVTVTQCTSYVNTIKAMRDVLENELAWDCFGPTDHKLGNYILEQSDGSILIWVRYTTVFELQPQEQGDSK